MSSTEKDAWGKVNAYLNCCVHNATHFPESTNMVYELNNLLCSFTKPRMLERSIVTEVEKILHKQMRDLGDKMYEIKGI